LATRRLDLAHALPARAAKAASFDSASVMVDVTARFLAGRQASDLGAPGSWLRPALGAVNQLPGRLRALLYGLGSGREACSARAIAAVSAEDLAGRTVAAYPRRRYPAVIVGAATGSMAHLAAALGIPVLPQTLLLPLRMLGRDVDDPAADIERARSAAQAMLEANPELVLHQMMDPNADRLTLSYFSYFRVKRRILGAAYESFLREVLAPGGTVIVADCRHRRPVTRIGERHFFQFGGVGALTIDELYGGGDRVAAFLAAQGSARRRWDPPAADSEAVEAEWGFDEALGADIDRFAGEYGFAVRRVSFDEADSASSFIADLYRWWYARLDRPDGRLFVESFMLLDPWWVLATSAVPYWMTFNSELGAAGLQRYLDDVAPYDDIDLTLVSNGLRTIGLPSTQRWLQLLNQARHSGRFAGVDTERFPSDLAVFARYQDTLRQARTFRMPEPLSLADIATFCAEYGDRYPVTWA
jgi:hypothetical protein